MVEIRFGRYQGDSTSGSSSPPKLHPVGGIPLYPAFNHFAAVTLKRQSCHVMLQ
jgi:hypothetical protein